MSKRESRTETRNLILHLLISFGWFWLVQLPRLLAGGGLLSLPAGLDTILGYVGPLAPAIAATFLSGINRGWPAVAAPWHRAIDRDWDRRWLLPTVLLIPATGLLTYLCMLVLDRPVAWQYALSLSMLVPIFLLILVLGALPEEIGWRGYALDRLQLTQNALSAGLLLGLRWGVWHLPLHFIGTTVQAAIPVWQYVLQTVVLSVLYTWLCTSTGGSILVATLFHAMGNFTGAVLPAEATRSAGGCSLASC